MALVLTVMSTSCNRRTATVVARPNVETPPEPQQAPKIAVQKDMKELEAEGNFPRPSNADKMTSPDKKADDNVLTFQRTACFGQCPVYKLTIARDGNMTYEGIRNVKRMGLYTAMLNPDEQKELIARMNNSKFFSLQESYPAKKEMITDLPNAITTYSWSGRSHTVTNNHEAPQELLQVEAYIDAMIEDRQWVKE